MKHTPAPWRYRPDEFDDWGWIKGPENTPWNTSLVAIARPGFALTEEQLYACRTRHEDPAEANAAFIIRAVNAHEALVEALKKIAEFQRDKCERAPQMMLFALLDIKVETARAALALAGATGTVNEPGKPVREK